MPAITVGPSDPWVDILEGLDQPGDWDTVVTFDGTTASPESYVFRDRPIQPKVPLTIRCAEFDGAVFTAMFLSCGFNMTTFENTRHIGPDGLAGCFNVKSGSLLLRDVSGDGDGDGADGYFLMAVGACTSYIRPEQREVLIDWTGSIALPQCVIDIRDGGHLKCAGEPRVKILSDKSGEIVQIAEAEARLSNTIILGGDKTNGGIGLMVTRTSKVYFTQTHDNAQHGIYQCDIGIHSGQDSTVTVDAPSGTTIDIKNNGTGIKRVGSRSVAYKNVAFGSNNTNVLDASNFNYI